MQYVTQRKLIVAICQVHKELHWSRKSFSILSICGCKNTAKLPTAFQLKQQMINC